MKNKNRQFINRAFIAYFIGFGALMFIIIFLITGAQIGYDVNKQCELAQNSYGGECAVALMSKIADNSSPYGKNSAIWALGQLGDKKALPFLEKYETGGTFPEHEEWDKGISQYELHKAIKLLKSGVNISAFVWRD